MPGWLAKVPEPVRAFLGIEDAYRCVLTTLQLVVFPKLIFRSLAGPPPSGLLGPGRFSAWWLGIAVFVYSTRVGFTVLDEVFEGRPLVIGLLNPLFIALTAVVLILWFGLLPNAILMAITRRATWRQVRSLNLYLMSPTIAIGGLLSPLDDTGPSLSTPASAAWYVIALWVAILYLYGIIFLHFQQPRKIEPTPRDPDAEKFCPQCGGQYRTGAIRCVDCSAILVSFEAGQEFLPAIAASRRKAGRARGDT